MIKLMYKWYDDTDRDTIMDCISNMVIFAERHRIPYKTKNLLPVSAVLAIFDVISDGSIMQEDRILISDENTNMVGAYAIPFEFLGDEKIILIAKCLDEALTPTYEKMWKDEQERRLEEEARSFIQKVVQETVTLLHMNRIHS